VTLEKLQIEETSTPRRSSINFIYIFAIVCIAGPPIFGVSGFLYGELIGKRLIFDLPFYIALIFSVPISYYLGATYTIMLALYIGFRNASGWTITALEVALCALATAAIIPPALLFGNIKYIPDQLIRLGPSLVIEALVLWFILIKVGLIENAEATS